MSRPSSSTSSAARASAGYAACGPAMGTSSGRCSRSTATRSSAGLPIATYPSAPTAQTPPTSIGATSSASACCRSWSNSTRRSETPSCVWPAISRTSKPSIATPSIATARTLSTPTAGYRSTPSSARPPHRPCSSNCSRLMASHPHSAPTSPAPSTANPVARSSPPAADGTSSKIAST